MKQELTDKDVAALVPGGPQDHDTPDALRPASRRGIYVRYVSLSTLVVIGFAVFQHLVVLRIPLAEVQPAMLLVPALVGALFGYLLARVRILHVQSEYQLRLLTEHDARLQQEIAVRKGVEASLRQQRRRLQMANDELKSFSYSVSHDLRAPARTVGGFGQALLEDYGDQLDDTATDYLNRIVEGCRRMDSMIDSLLLLSRVSSADIVRETVDLSELAGRVLARLAEREPERRVAVEIQPGLRVEGDRGLLTVVMENLLGNAWKFSAGRDQARIGFTRQRSGGENWYCVADNGAGFDARHVDNLFMPFSRLHRHEEFPGSGIGLATVRRAVQRHGGHVRASGKPDEGATFCFTLN